jgi:hypothetical protein
MKKILIISLFLTLAVSSVSFAASARWQALGNDHRFIIDSTNYTLYPGRITVFGNALWLIPAVSATADDYYAKKNFTDNAISAGCLLNMKNMTLAYHYNLPSNSISNLNGALAKFSGQNDRLSSLALRGFPDLFWGMKTGNMSLGARFALAMDNGSVTVVEKDVKEGDVVRKVTEAVQEISTSANAFEIGLGATMYKTPAGDVDLGARIGLQSFSETNPNLADVKSTGGMDINIDARLNKPKGETYMLVPFINVNIGSLPSAEYNEKSAPNVAEVSYMKGELGVGFRNQIKDKGMLVAGVVAGYNSTSTTATVKGKTLPDTKNSALTATILSGYERPVLKWLVVRGGANVKFSTGTTELVVNDKVESKKASNVDYYYNAGIRTIYNGFIVDFIVLRNIFHRGPFLLSGVSDGWASNVCITYSFN